MTHRRRITSALVLVAIMMFGTAGVARAQVPYDPTKKLETLTSVTSDSAGNAQADVTLPGDVTAGYEVIASGKDPDGNARSVIATVSTDGSAMSAVDGHAIALIAYTQAVARNIHVSATGFAANSKVTFSVRFVAAATGGSGALPFSGSNVGLLLAIAAAVLLVGGPLTFGSKKLADRVQERAVD